MVSNITLYRKNDQVIRLQKLQDSMGGVVTGALITGTLVNGAGTALVSITFGDIADNPGDYSAPISVGDIPVDGNYTLQVLGSVRGLVFYFETAVIVADRIV